MSENLISVIPFTVHSFQADVNANARISALFNFMQEAAWQSAESLGFGFNDLMAHNLIWVLSRQYLRIQRLPKWGEDIRIKTWPSGQEKIFCYRDYELLDSEDNILLQSTSAWFAVNVENRRPQRTSTFYPETASDFPAKIFPDRSFQKLSWDSEDVLSNTLSVGFQDLDVNDHANNTRYIDWLMEGLPLQFLKSHFLAELEMNFLAEAVYQDRIAILQSADGLEHYNHRLRREADGTELFRAQTRWQSL